MHTARRTWAAVAAASILVASSATVASATEDDNQWGVTEGDPAAAPIRVRAGIQDAQGNIVQDTVYATAADVPEMIDVVAEFSIAPETGRAQSAESVSFAAESLGGGTVTWEKCDKLGDENTVSATHTFSSGRQPTSKTALRFLYQEHGVWKESGGLGARTQGQRVLCTGKLDSAELLKGNTHEGKTTVWGAGADSNPGMNDAPVSRSSQSFTARIAEATVRGSVTDQETGLGIRGVSVSLIDQVSGDPAATTSTDTNGAYIFGNVAPGTYRVEFMGPDVGEGKAWTWAEPEVGMSNDFAIKLGDSIIQDAKGKLEDIDTLTDQASTPDPHQRSVSTGTWLTKSPAQVQCPDDDSDECTVSWNIVAFNGSSSDVNQGFFTDVASKRVYDAEATINIPASQLATGASFSIALDRDGEVWTWGDNANSQLGVAGLSKSTKYPTPQHVVIAGLENDEVVVQVAAGNTTAYVLTSYGRVFSWGNNIQGQAGVGSYPPAYYEVPTEAAFPRNVVQIVGGNTYVAALTATGEVYTAGSAANGRLGNGQSSGKVLAPTKVKALDGVVISQIAGGDDHTLAVSASGEMYAWGNNRYGKLGLGDNAPNPVLTPLKSTVAPPEVSAVAAGKNHSLLLTVDGGIYSFGQNASGALGLGFTSTQLGSRSTPTKIESLPKISQVVAGNDFSTVLAKTGEVFAWGSNTNGRLGTGSTQPPYNSTSVSPAIPAGVRVAELSSAATASHVLALATTGELYAWGYNVAGQTGNGATVTTVATPTRVVNGDKTGHLEMGSSKSVGLSSLVDPVETEIKVTGQPYGCMEGDNTPQCAPRGETFTQREYSNSEGTNEALALRSHGRAFITVSGKVDRGAKGFTIGNQAYFSSDVAPMAKPELQPLFPGFDETDPGAYGTWDANAVCSPGLKTQCDQVWASVDGSKNVGKIRGIVSRTADEQGGISPTGGVTVELYKGDPANGGTLVESTVSNAQGIYSFNVVVGSGYYVKFLKDSLPAAPTGKGWVWSTGGVNPISSAGVSLPRAVVKTPGGIVTVEQNAFADLERVIPTSMTVTKGWKDAEGQIVGSVAYGGEVKGKKEIVTVEVVNTGEDTLTGLLFSDKTEAGDPVEWNSCRLLDEDGKPAGSPFDLRSVKNPEKLPLTDITVAEGQTLSCTGSLALDNVTKDRGHQDIVTINATGQTGGKSLVGDGTFTAAYSGSGELAVEKGVLVRDGKTGVESIASNHYVPYNESQDVTVRVKNNGDKDLKNVKITDKTVEGPDVTGLDTSCDAVAEVVSGGSVDCSGTLKMTAYKHQNTVTVTAEDKNGGVYKTYADFSARSGGSLPRAGMFGIGAFVVVGGLVLAGALAAVVRVGRTPKGE